MASDETTGIVGLTSSGAELVRFGSGSWVIGSELIGASMGGSDF